MPPSGSAKSSSRRGFRFSREKIAYRAQVLALSMGLTALIIAALMAGLSFAHENWVQPRILRLAFWCAIAGVVFLVLRFLFHSIPQWLAQRRSPVFMRRKALNERRSRRAAPTPAAPVPPVSPRQGGVLLLVLVLLGLVSALVVQSQLLARGRLQREQVQLRAAELQRAAADAARAALQRLADDADLEADHSNETWAVREELTTPLGISTQVRVADESRLFDLNNLRTQVPPGQRRPDDIVLDLMTLCGDFTPSLQVNALTDYIDDDDMGPRESNYYAKQDPPQACPNRLLYGWAEVQQVEGWTRELFAPHVRSRLPGSFDADLNQCLTLLPIPREKPLPININTASREALTGVLGLGQEYLVSTILTLRSLKPIRSLEALALLAEPEYFESVRPYLDVRSRVYRVQARAYADGHTETLHVLASRGADGRIDILQWIF